MPSAVESSKARFEGSLGALGAILLLVSAGCNSPAQEAATAAAHAAAAFDAGDYGRSRSAVQSALRLRDDVPEYWLILARSELALRNYAGAFDAFSRANELDRANVETLRVLTELSVMTGRYDEAEEYMDQLLALDPGDVRGRIAKGHIALERKDTKAALLTAEEVIRSDPGYLGATVLKAKALAASGGYREAAKILENSMRVHGQNVSVLEALLETYRRAGDHAGERHAYTRLLALSPDDTQLQLDYARALYRQGNLAAGFEQLLRLQRSRPADHRIPGQIANLWLQIGNTPAGLREIRAVSSDGSPAAKIAMARYALDTRWPDEAVRILAPLASGEPTYGTAGAAALYAEALLKAGRPGEAVTSAERVLALDSTNPRALAVKTKVALDRRQLNDALAGAMLLVTEHPRIGDYRALLSRVYMEKGEMNLAFQTLRQASKEFPASSAVLRAYVAFLERQGNLEQALALADSFTTRNPGSAEGWDVRTQLCRKAGDGACLAYSHGKLGKLAQGARV